MNNNTFINFDLQTFATTYTTQTYTTTTQTQTTATPIEGDATLPALTLEDLVNKDKLNVYAKKVTKFYDKRYLRNAEVTFIDEKDIDEIVAGLEDSTIKADTGEDTVPSGDGDDTPSGGDEPADPENP